MRAPRNKIIIIGGPSASGKSALALYGAQMLNGAIINADSMQIYKGMNIGTAKPSPEEQAFAPHFLFNVAAPDEDFDAARYMALADNAIAAAIQDGLVPIVVGGTGLYLRALLYGLCDAPEIAPKIKAKYRELHTSRGAPYLYALLTEKDPAMAARLHANDYVRVIRALEVLEATNESLAVWQTRHGGFNKPRYDALKIGVNLERAELYRRIDARVHTMLERGFEDEVRELLAQGYGPELKAMGAIGYKHMAAYLNGTFSHAEMVDLMQRDTRRYAKRQLTWFLREEGFVWLGAYEKEKFLDLANLFLKA